MNEEFADTNNEPVEQPSGTENEENQFKWYTMQVFTGQEEKVLKYMELEIDRQNLKELIPSVHLPTQNSVEVRGGKKKVVTRVRYPGYMFIQMVVNKLTRHFISNVPNVLGFVGTDGEPVALSEAEVLRIIGRTETGEVLPEHQFQVGDKVKVIDGAFVDFEGVIHEINLEKKRLKVFVSIFGRATPLDLAFYQIEALAEEK